MKSIRGFLLLLAIIVMAAWLPGNAAAAEHVASGTCGENLTWVLTDDGTLTISGTGDMMECVNPTYVPWRIHTDTIMNVIIQHGVTGIGDWAFYGCSNLKGVAIPDSVTSIGDYAFHSCGSLTGVVIPHGVTSIGSGAFTGCSSLTDIVIPDSVTSIGTGAFNGCSSLTDIEISAGLTTIGSYAFKNCSGLTDIEIPTSVTSIGSNAFEGCSGLINVTIPDASIGSGVFQNCSITKLVVAEGSKTVTSAMVMCKGTLEEVILPDSLTSIGDHAFESCSALTSITIPDGVISIGSSAFEDCSGLTNIVIPDNVTSIGDYAFCGCESMTSVTVGSSVTSIGSGAFWGCISLTRFTIPDSVSSIGDNAFMACKIKKLIVAEGSKTVTSVMVVCKDSLEEVILPEGLDSIGEDAFRGCKGLAEITLPNGMTSIENRAFWGCSGLRSIAIPDSVTGIGNNAFYECSGLRSVTLGDNLTSIGEEAFSGCSSLMCIALPDGVTSIGEGAFGGCSSLTSITIPEGVSSIEPWTFSGCSGLTSITLPERVSGIGAFAFRLCSSLKSVTVPDGTANIFAEAFSGCTSLTSVTIPDSVKHIEYAAFKDCNSLSDVYYTGSESEWKTITVDVDNYKLLSANIHYVHAAVNADVVRVFGADRYATAFKAADTLKEELGVQKFQNVIVASGTGFADALAGSYLAAQKNAPILLVRGANVDDVKNYIKQNLASGGTVYLLGGVNAVPKAMETGLEGFNVKRLGGANRYDTNLLILQEAGVGDKDIIVCTGLNFADSLSASATGLPILLVKDSLYANQKEFLKANGGNFIVVGGTNAVNATVEKQLATYGSVKRLAGNTRYDTSVLVAKEFFDAPKSAVLAYAQNFPDGLSGGPLAYVLNAPLILTDSKKPTAAVTYATGAGIKSGYVLGGPGLISDKVVKNIFSMAANASITVK